MTEEEFSEKTNRSVEWLDFCWGCDQNIVGPTEILCEECREKLNGD